MDQPGARELLLNILIYDVSEEVWPRVARHLQSAPALFVSTGDGSASGEEGLWPAHRMRGLKSGKDRTMGSIVTRKVVWPHEEWLRNPRILSYFSSNTFWG